MTEYSNKRHNAPNTHTLQSTECSNYFNMAKKKRNKWLTYWKGKNGVSICKWNDFLYGYSFPRNLQNYLLELMSSAKLQDTRSTCKNQSHLYILRTYKWKAKLKTDYHIHISKKKKDTLRCVFDKTHTGLVSWKLHYYYWKKSKET